MNNFLNFFTIKPTQTFNNCDKPVYELTDIERLKRFIFLGSDNGSMYMNQNTLTLENVLCLENLIKECKYDDILDVINTYKHRTFKNDYLIYVLARCCSIHLDDDPLFWKKDFRTDCFKLMLDVCHIPTHLFMFIQFYEKINKRLYNSTGWNSQLKNTISQWYLTKTPQELMYHITKYPSRYNWSHKDILKLAHIKPKDDITNDIFKYILYNNLDISNTYFEYLLAYENLKKDNNVDNVINQIVKHNFVREHIPTHLLNEDKVWVHLIPHMPIISLLRNLNKITSLQILDTYPHILEQIIDKITNVQVNPLQLLITIKMYKSGKGMKGGLKWEPNNEIIKALNKAFYSTFNNLKKSNKKILLALDVSASMSWNTVCGIDSLSASEVSCAMAMMFDYISSDVDIMGFSSTFKKLDISSKYCLEENLEYVKDNTFGSTDCALPFVWAGENNKEYDAIIVFTDNETNSNTIDPSMALQLYRNQMNKNTKLIVVALTSNGFSIANPDDSNMMDVCGFDSNMYDMIHEFIEI
jgi:60 kDa SS-A/Ro ribonucleoprotein